MAVLRQQLTFVHELYESGEAASLLAPLISGPAGRALSHTIDSPCWACPVAWHAPRAPAALLR